MSVIPFLLPLAALLSLWLYPSAAPMLSGASLLVSVGMAVYAIFQKRRGAEGVRIEIAKEAFLLGAVLILVLLLGGMAAMLANTQVSARWGAAGGL